MNMNERSFDFFKSFGWLDLLKLGWYELRWANGRFLMEENKKIGEGRRIEI